MTNAIWFLAATLCLGDTCNDYVIDAGLSYRDCVNELVKREESAVLFSLRCDRGTVEKMEGGENGENTTK